MAHTEEELSNSAKTLIVKIKELSPKRPCFTFNDDEEPLVSLEWAEAGLFVDVTNTDLELGVVVETSRGIEHLASIYDHTDPKEREEGLIALQKSFEQLQVAVTRRPVVVKAIFSTPNETLANASVMVALWEGKFFYRPCADFIFCSASNMIYEHKEGGTMAIPDGTVLVDKGEDFFRLYVLPPGIPIDDWNIVEGPIFKLTAFQHTLEWHQQALGRN